jgi:hypothetical protein
MFALLLVIMFVAGYFWLHSYLRSDGFRRQLASEIGGALNGQVEMAPLDWRGVAVSSEEIEVESRNWGRWWGNDADAVFDLGGLWARTWRVESLVMDRVRVEFGTALDKPNIAKSAEGEHDQEKSRSETFPGSGFLPNRTEVSQFAIRDFDGRFVSGNEEWSWQNVALEGQPRGGDWEITLQGGRVKAPWENFGSFQLQNALLRQNDDRLFLTGSEWRVLDEGLLTLRGRSEEGHVFLDGDLDDVSLAPLLSPFWEQRLSGELSGDFSFTSDEGEVAGSANLENGVLRSLPLLDRLASYAGTSRLLRLTLEECRANYSWRKTAWSLSKIRIRDEGLLCIEGNLHAEGESLAGDLQVGVPPGLLASIPGAEEKVFLPGKEGLLWTPVQISGSTSRPKEDLSGRMIRAAQERMFEIVPETGRWALRYGAETLDDGTRTLLENQDVVLEQGAKAADEALKQGGKVMEEGVRTGFGLLNGLLGGERNEDEPSQ